MCSPPKSPPRKVYAECNIVIQPTVTAKPTRKRFAEVNMDILSGMSVGPAPMEPITLVIKGGNWSRVLELMTLYHKSDEEIVEKVRDSVLADEVEGMTVEETAAWVRDNVMAELSEMSGEVE